MTTKSIVRNVIVATVAILAGGGVFAFDLSWNTGTGNWDDTTSNWNAVPTTYIEGDDVTFDDITGTGGTVTVQDLGSSGGVTPGSTTVDGAAAYTFDGDSILGGALTKTGAGALKFTNAANSFDSVDLGGGQLWVDNPNQLGSGTITFSNDAIFVYDTTTAPVALSNAIQINDGVTAIFDIDHNASGTWNLSGLVSGGTVANPVTLEIREVNLAGGSFDRVSVTNSANSFIGTLRLRSRAMFYWNGQDGVFGDAGNAVTLASGGRLALNGFTLNRNITGAGALVGSGAVAGQLSGSTYEIFGTVTLSNPGNTNTAILLAQNGGAGTLVVSDPRNIGAANALITMGLYGSQVRIEGTSSANFTATMRVNNNGNGSTFPAINVVDPEAVINWTGELDAAASSGTVDTLRKLGAGTVNFSNIDINSGALLALNLQQGTLNVNDANSGAGSFHNITVSSDATLGGTGLIDLASGTSITVNTGGTLNPGASAGTLTVDGDVTFQDGSFFEVEIEGVGDGEYDRLVVTNGTITLASGSLLSLSPGAFTGTAGDILYILDNQTEDDITGLFQYAEGAKVGSFGGARWAITYLADTGNGLTGGNDIALVAVPEPASVLLLGLLGMLALRRRKTTMTMQTATRSLLAVAVVVLTGTGVSAADVSWDGGSANWDDSTTIWNAGATAYSEGDDVTFDDTTGSGGTVTVQDLASSGGVTPGSTTVDGAAAYTFDGDSILGGTLTKTGAGTLTFTNAANSFDSVDLGGGQVWVSNPNQLGSGTITFSDDTILVYDTAVAPVALSNAIQIDNDVTATFDIDHNASGNWNMDGLISGGTIANPVNLVLREVNLAGGSFDDVSLTNAANSFVGHLTLQDRADLDWNGSDGVFGDSSNYIEMTGRSILNLNNHTLARDVSFSGAGTLQNGTVSGQLINSGGYAEISGTVTLTNTANTVSTFYIAQNSANATLSVSDPGSLGNALLQMAPQGSNLRITGTPTGNFTATLRTENNGDARLPTLNVQDANAVVNWTGLLNARASGGTVDTLRKQGDGTVNFSNITINTGAFLGLQIEQGTLNVNDSDSGTGQYSNITVANDATLGGTGLIDLAAGASVTVNTGGTLAPGTSAGTLTVDGDINFQDGSFFEVEIEGVGDGEYDRLVVTSGAITVVSGAQLSLTGTSFTGTTGDILYILDNQTESDIVGLFQYAEGDKIGSFGGVPWAITYLADTGNGLTGGNDIALVAIPEPASVLLLGLLGMLALRRRKTTMTMQNATRSLLAVAVVVLTGTGVSATDVSWNTGTGNWDDTTSNWNPGPTTYSEGDDVTFDDTTGSGGTVTITDLGSGGVTPGSTTVDGAAAYTLAGNSILGGTLTKTGAGILTFTNAANSFTSVGLDGGTLDISNVNQLGSGTISFTNSATIDYDPAAGPSALANDITIANDATASFYSEHDGLTNWQFTGKISGGTTLNPVTIVVGKPLTGGTFQDFNFTNTNNDYVGTLHLLNRSYLDYNNIDAAYGAAGSTISAEGAQCNIDLNGYVLSRDVDGGTASLTVNNGTLAGVATGNIYAGSTLTLTNTSNDIGFLGIANGPVAVVSDPGNIGPDSGSLVNLGNNSTLRITGTPVGSFEATLQIETTGTPQLKATVEVTDANAVINWAGPVVTRQTDTDILVKSGLGTLNLNNFGLTGFTGSMIIEVNQGRLNLNDSSVVAGTFDSISVADGATLGGTGLIDLAAGASVTVNAGGTLAPGTSAGTLTVDGDVTFQDGSFFEVELEGVGDGEYDRLVVTNGTITLASGSLLSLAPGTFTGTTGDILYILDNQTEDNIAGLFQYAEGAKVGAFGGVPWAITYLADTGNGLTGGNDIALVAIPEPASVVLLGLLGMLALRRRKTTMTMQNATRSLLAVAVVVLTGTGVSATDVSWNTGTGNWDDTTSNWNPGPTTYSEGDDVTFDDTTGSGGTVTITDLGSGGVTPGSTTVDGAAAYTFGGDSILGGTLTKTGAGTLTFTNATNSFDSVDLGGGQLWVSNPNQLGSGTITFSSDAIFVYDTAVAPVALSNAIQIDNDVTATFDIDHNASGNWNMDGLISGGTIANPVNLVLREVNLAGGSFDDVSLTNAANSFVGHLTLQDRADLDWNGSDGVFGDSSNYIEMTGRSILQLNGNTLTRNVAFTGGGSLVVGTVSGQLSGGGSAEIAGTVTLTNTGNSINQLSLGSNGNTADLRVSEAGNLGTTVAFSSYSGTLHITGTPSESFGATMFIENNNTGGDLNRSKIIVEEATAVIDWTGQVYTRQDDQDNLAKWGAGTLNLSNFAVTGTLALNVAEGTLNLNDATPGTNVFGPITVQSGATLGGTGLIDLASGASVTVNTGGTLNPGASAGTLTVDGDVTFQDGSFFEVEIEGVGDGEYDRLVVTNGTITLASGSLLSLAPGTFTGTTGDILYILDNQTESDITGLFQYAEGDKVGAFGGVPWAITYLADTGNGLTGGNDIALVAIPEPASVLLLGLLGMLALRRRTR